MPIGHSNASKKQVVYFHKAPRQPDAPAASARRNAPSRSNLGLLEKARTWMAQTFPRISNREVHTPGLHDPTGGARAPAASRPNATAEGRHAAEIASADGARRATGRILDAASAGDLCGFTQQLNDMGSYSTADLRRAIASANPAQRSAALRVLHGPQMASLREALARVRDTNPSLASPAARARATAVLQRLDHLKALLPQPFSLRRLLGETTPGIPWKQQPNYLQLDIGQALLSLGAVACGPRPEQTLEAIDQLVQKNMASSLAEGEAGTGGVPAAQRNLPEQTQLDWGRGWALEMRSPDGTLCRLSYDRRSQEATLRGQDAVGRSFVRVVDLRPQEAGAAGSGEIGGLIDPIGPIGPIGRLAAAIGVEPQRMWQAALLMNQTELASSELVVTRNSHLTAFFSYGGDVSVSGTPEIRARFEFGAGDAPDKMVVDFSRNPPHVPGINVGSAEGPELLQTDTDKSFLRYNFTAAITPTGSVSMEPGVTRLDFHLEPVRPATEA